MDEQIYPILWMIGTKKNKQTNKFEFWQKKKYSIMITCEHDEKEKRQIDWWNVIKIDGIHFIQSINWSTPNEKKNLQSFFIFVLYSSCVFICNWMNNLLVKLCFQKKKWIDDLWRAKKSEWKTEMDKIQNSDAVCLSLIVCVCLFVWKKTWKVDNNQQNN